MVVHVEPVEDVGLRDRANAAALAVPNVREIHNLVVVHVAGRTELSLHLKLPGDLSLADAHALAEEVEQAIHRAVPEVDSVQTHLEPLAEPTAAIEEAVDASTVERIVREVTGVGAARGAVPAHRRRARRVAHAGPGRDEYLGRGARASERDRGANPPRSARDHRRDRPHRALR